MFQFSVKYTSIVFFILLMIIIIYLKLQKNQVPYNNIINHETIFKEIKHPDFFIIGVQKSGTTAARFNMRLHPNISMSNHEMSMSYYGKMQIYFINTDKDIEFKPFSLFGISSPRYIFDANKTYSLYHYFPSAKIIVFIRNPVIRTFSNFEMRTEKELMDGNNSISIKNKLVIDFERMITDYLLNTTILNDSQHALGDDEDADNIIFKRGLYAEQFERLSSLYPREQIHIECSEDISETLNYNSIFRFLNIPEINITAKHVQPKGFEGKHSLIMNEKSFSMLSQFYKSSNQLFLLWLQAYKDKISTNKTIDVISHYQGLIKCVKKWNQLSYTSYLQSV